ncbi:MAG: hypothetical protein AAGJ35_00265 [Myxococcota bacterium]
MCRRLFVFPTCFLMLLVWIEPTELYAQTSKTSTPRNQTSKTSTPENETSSKVLQSTPPQLLQWKDWVLYRSKQPCPQADGKQSIQRCRWPSLTHIHVLEKKGSFTQFWHVFRAGWVHLPGNLKQWPEQVQKNQKPIIVVPQRGRPAIFLSPGLHEISGRFSWSEPPRMLALPVSIGLVQLEINGQEKKPQIDAKGQLWLQPKSTSKRKENRLSIRIFRQIRDGNPVLMTHLIRLSISGRARELNLPSILPTNNEVIGVQSRLPVAIHSRTMRVQARAGEWAVRIQTRFHGPVHSIGPISAKYGRELWSVIKDPQLRTIEVLGPPSLVPQQTRVPRSWYKHPLYLMKAASTMKLKTKKPVSTGLRADKLTLRRTWIMDFDGKGYTVHDTLNGQVYGRSLQMSPKLQLGFVSVNGKPQLITQQGKQKHAGVELRKTQLEMKAVSRYQGDVSRLPAVGWKHDMRKLYATLVLPPGYRLLAAAGADYTRGAWLDKWNLLDCFIVLLIAIAIWRLAGLSWGFIGICALILTYHEVHAPRLLWVSLLAALALLRVLPQSWFRSLVNAWRIGTIVLLLIYAIPFLLHQARSALHPQLEYHRPSSSVNFSISSSRKAFRKVMSIGRKKRKYSEKSQNVDVKLLQDPQSVVQTGPGVPKRQWKSYQLQWSQHVKQNESIQLWILSPFYNRMMTVLRILLMACLLFGLIGLRRWWRLPQHSAAAAMLAMLYGASFGLNTAHAAPDTPSKAPMAKVRQHKKSQNKASTNTTSTQHYSPSSRLGSPNPQFRSQVFPPYLLLDELKARLTQKPSCLPSCAHFAHMHLSIDNQQIQIRLRVHAASRIAVPLPGNAKDWLPQRIMYNGKSARTMQRDRKGRLWLLIAKGIHNITLLGSVPERRSFELRLPLKPSRVRIQTKGWKVAGLSQSGQISKSLLITRTQKSQKKTKTFSQTVIKPFLRIKRTFHLGIPPWTIHTQVRRVTPKGTQVILSYPLLSGESVTSGVEVKKGRVQIVLSDNQSQMEFRSTLNTATRLTLQAEPNPNWSEEWKLDVSPIWHYKLTGTPPLQNNLSNQFSQPTWFPWPKDRVQIHISRPKAISGSTVTIDRAELSWSPGKRIAQSTLNFTVRSSIGRQHQLTLPTGARPQSIQIDNVKLPISTKSSVLEIPLAPGKQRVQVTWEQSIQPGWKQSMPTVHLGTQAVNATLSVTPNSSRWLLLTKGPKLGPAVLFWSYLIVICLFALALGRISWTPLKTHHWLLLGLGLTQISSPASLIIVGWFLLLGQRQKGLFSKNWALHNFAQLGIVGWTLATFVCLYVAIYRGLLGLPRMQVLGNGSSQYTLHWYVDRISGLMPQACIYSVPMWMFRALMLIWALWLAFSLIKWLKWGWNAFQHNALWVPIGEPMESDIDPEPSTAGAEASPSET